jgi:hypothetical protein
VAARYERFAVGRDWTAVLRSSERSEPHANMTICSVLRCVIPGSAALSG